jgi:nucleotidyltransferase substrate binding protein (TIGR01987 family)
MTSMAATSIDTGPLRRALAMLREALDFWHQQADGTPLKPHLRSAVIQSFEFSYELSVRLLRRVLIERAAAAPEVTELSFNDLLRSAAVAGLLAEPLRWREWRELRNATSHAYDEGTAQAVAGKSAVFLVDAEALLLQLEDSLGR